MTATLDEEADGHAHVNTSISRFLSWVYELQTGVEVMELFAPSAQRLGQTIDHIVQSAGGEWPVGDPEGLLRVLAEGEVS